MREARPELQRYPGTASSVGSASQKGCAVAVRATCIESMPTTWDQEPHAGIQALEQLEHEFLPHHHMPTRQAIGNIGAQVCWCGVTFADTLGCGR